jgi:fatty-acyl-CoA synthase
MSLTFSDQEREQLNRTASDLINAHPRVIDLIVRGAAANPQGLALVYLRTPMDDDPIMITYEQLMGSLAAAVDWYRKLGIGAGDIAAILAPAAPATFVALWAATVAGVSKPLNLLFSRDAIASQLNATRAKVLLVPPPGLPGGLYERAEGLMKEVPSLKRIVVIPLDGSVSFDGEALKPDPNWRATFGAASAGEAERITAMLPTGGTTGQPKIAKLSNRNMVASAIASMLAIGVTPSDHALVAVPLFHVGGAFVGSLASLAAGATIYFPTAMGMRNPEVVTYFWKILERWAITFAAIVPTSLGAVAEMPLDGADLSKLRFVGTGASTCPPEIERRFLSTWGGDAIRQVYGMTEYSGAITQVPHDKQPDGAAVGLPVALTQVAVLTDAGISQGSGSPMGELLARGPQVFAGYVDAQQTERAFYQGWLRTGDLCRIEPSGQVLVTGRIKDLIIRGGHNIDPMMIEEAALQFPGISLAAAVGRPDPYSGEVPMLFVTPARDAIIDIAALADFMAGRVADASARPKAIEIMAEIPLTPVGKIFKPRLREIAAEQAVRQLLATQIALPASHVRAITDPHRGLIVEITITDDSAERTSIKQLLGKLPLIIDLKAAEPLSGGAGSQTGA